VATPPATRLDFFGAKYVTSVCSMRRTQLMPFMTLPNTTCLPSRWGVSVVVMKNCEPFVPGPAVAARPSASWACTRDARGADRITRVGHGEEARGRVLVDEVLVVKLFSVD
jgi:hypothetical protein